MDEDDIFMTLTLTLTQGWRNVPAHIELHADWSSDPPGELHPRRTPAGGGKVLRASWSVLANKKVLATPLWPTFILLRTCVISGGASHRPFP